VATFTAGEKHAFRTTQPSKPTSTLPSLRSYCLSLAAR
jgi:hypothetical protein